MLALYRIFMKIVIFSVWRHDKAELCFEQDKKSKTFKTFAKMLRPHRGYKMGPGRGPKKNVHD